jgi:hypothetical protein
MIKALMQATSEDGVSESVVKAFRGNSSPAKLETLIVFATLDE